MTDASHIMGGDLGLRATGDLLLATGDTEVQQRVLRRLLTNPLAYLWAPTYGAGLGAMIGRPADASRITGIILQQIQLEAGVAPSPAPTVAVSATPDGAVTATVTYTDATTGATTWFSVP